MKDIGRIFVTLAAILGAITIGFVQSAYASETVQIVSGNLYKFDTDSSYAYTSESAVLSEEASIVGELSVSGNLQQSDTDQYTVSSGTIAFNYDFHSDILQRENTMWRIVNDKSETVNGIPLEKDILSGAIIVQTSLDGENWYTDSIRTNAFNSDDDFSEPIYTAKDIQLQNGCYYRIIIAYELQMKIGETKIAFVTTDVTESKRIAEVYEIYAVTLETDGTAHSASLTPRMELGSKVSTGKDNGYSGSSKVDKDDPHFGWDLGSFVINGYTRETTDGDTPVFLKNVGDKVTLWFTLKQNINCLNGDSTLTISEDKNGYDKDFEVPQSNFGQGTLIIRYTDYQGNVHDPIIYQDFLAANASTGADTRVQLFEEGNYDVTLDYEIKHDQHQVASVSVLPTYTNYKIEFSFEIRNGNCMVFPMDVTTGAELANYDITVNGFRLDMARSRYLTIDVQRSVINVDSNGQLSEDVRFNRPAKDGESYTDEGIYTFSVKNLYTGETTVKTICVGSDDYYRAIAKNKITVTELNTLISSGSVIENDGTVTGYVPSQDSEEETETVPQTDVPDVSVQTTEAPVISETEQSSDSRATSDAVLIILIVAIAVVLIVGIIVFAKKKK